MTEPSGISDKLPVTSVADLAAEVEQLRVWKREALTVTTGLQDLGKALGVPLGHRITGPDATERAQALVAEVEKLRAKPCCGDWATLSRNLHNAEAERDRLRATITRVRKVADAWVKPDYTSDETEGFGKKILCALDGEVQ